MADDINPARRTELVAARDKLAGTPTSETPSIKRGLEDLVLTVVSDNLRAAYSHQLESVNRRINLIENELAWLDAVNSHHESLLEDGYPTDVQAILEPSLWEESQREQADHEAARAIFREAQAITLGAPTFTTQPAPTKEGP
jgi:hypothetical protein